MLVRFTLILSLSFFLIHFSLTGQSEGQTGVPCIEEYPTEEVVFFSDRDYYLTGESLWFKAFVFLDGKLSSDWSKVLYVELYNDQQDVLIQNKYKTENGMINGLLSIPEDVNTGHYFLRCYTRYGLNFPVENLYTKIISIVNPKSEPSYIDAVDLALEKEEIPVHTGDQLKPVPVTLSLSKDQFGKRERVALKIETDRNAYLAITVRKKGTSHSLEDLQQFSRINPWFERFAGDTDFALPIGFPGGEVIPASADLDMIPEMRGLTLSGKILDKTTGEPLANEYCITSVIGDQAQIHLDKTNVAGEFIFPFNDLQEEKDVFVSVRNKQNKDFEILINHDFSTSFPDLQAMPMPYDSSKHQLFKELYINKQLNEFVNTEIEQAAYTGNDPLPPYFNIAQADHVVTLQNFIKLPTVIEVFRELVPMVSLRGKIGSRRFHIFDKETLVNYDNPLVLLDFVPVSDIDNLLQIDPSQLEAIDVFYSDYLLGDHTLGGIISLRTQKGDFAGFKWTDNSVFLSYKTLQAEITFRQPVYSTPESKNNRKPDFRTLLYWNPKVQLNGEPLSLNFYTSDQLSDYEIVVRGFTEDGKACYGRIDFGVWE